MVPRGCFLSSRKSKWVTKWVTKKKIAQIFNESTQFLLVDQPYHQSNLSVIVCSGALFLFLPRSFYKTIS